MKRKPTNKKIRTNISLSKDMHDKIKQYDLSLSPFVEIRLREYFALIEKQDYQYHHTQYTPETHHQGTPPPGKTPGKNSELYGEVGLSEFESESLAPKAKRMDQATPQAPTYTV